MTDMPAVQVMYSGHQPSTAHLEHLRSLLPAHRIIATGSVEEAIGNAGDTEIILGHRFLRQTLPAVRRLYWVQSSGGGFDHLPWRETLAKGATLSVAGFAGPVVAQHAVMLALALNRRLSDCLGRQDAREWGDDLYGVLPPRLRTALVLGLGSIGSRVAGMLSAGGIEVWGVSRTPSDSSKVDRHFTTPRWRERVDQVDLIVNCLPGTADTDEILDSSTIARLKSTAILVNVGRCETLDLDALVARLREGTLGGAALDVLPHRLPLGRDSHLWDVPGLIITPYLAARYADRWRDLEAFVEAQVARWVRRQPLEGIVEQELQ